MTAVRTVYTVDDDVIIRKSLGFMLEEGGYSTRPFSNGNDFLDALSYLAPGCVLMDIHMPGLNGLEVQKRVAAQRPDMPVLMMTGAGDIPMAVEAIQAGAIDFIEKPFTDVFLTAKLEKIFAELPHFGEGAMRAAEAMARLNQLSSREREVAAGLRAGLSNKLIAYQLGLGVRTVETHRANMMRKLHVNSVAQIVQLAIDAHLEPLPHRAA